MTDIAKINDEVITADDFLKILRISNVFDNLIEEVMIDKLTLHAAKKHGITVSTEEIQERVDQLRRIRGLHRAKDTHNFLDSMRLTLDEFEDYIAGTLYREKMIAEVTTDEAVEEYFHLHTPKFDSIEISHITLDSEGRAKEMVSVLTDDPESFAELAKEYSLDADKDNGGVIGKVLRGSLKSDIEAKIFNASPGDLLGPFPSDDGNFFEIFKVDDKHPAALDDSIAQQVRKLIFDEWVAARAKEHRVEIL